MAWEAGLFSLDWIGARCVYAGRALAAVIIVNCAFIGSPLLIFCE